MMYKSQFWKIDPYDWFCGPGVGLHDIYIYIYPFSNGAAFNTQSRSSPTSYAIRAQNHRWIASDIERDIA